MIWIAAYLAVGAILYFWTVFRYSKDPDDLLLPIVTFWDPITWLLWLLWPITIWDVKRRVHVQIVRKRKEETIDPSIGRVGKTLTPMIPSGRIRLDEKDYEAVSDDGKLDRDEEVEVLTISMGTLKVRRSQPDAPGNRGKRPPLSQRPHENQPPQKFKR
ncbi:NfeD family protein [Pelagicoccus mobilis]|uniref:NfeD-like C-terminal domain-containing protein n=1 Tax=Pelagicoccus mobilis TaxID=415221 RepID=A0A934VSQ2_9BACT|nr:NfeD family protein [Pelagicoccus mobilis]MBK1880657.1 hypothetical protein [Pelagicoccus mobilis]